DTLHHIRLIVMAQSSLKLGSVGIWTMQFEHQPTVKVREAASVRLLKPASNGCSCHTLLGRFMKGDQLRAKFFSHSAFIVSFNFVQSTEIDATLSTEGASGS